MNDKRVQPVSSGLHVTYDNILIVRQPAERLVANVKIIPGQQVLDVACGTGRATMAAALVVGKSGRVTGIDIDDKMLDIAKQKAESASLTNVEYHVGDAEALEFSDAAFDVVICASAIFFLKDIPKALHEFHRVLKTGGILGFTSFGERFLQPVIKPLGERLSKYFGQSPPVPFFIERTNTPDKCQALLQGAGFEDIHITTEQLGFYLPDLTAYWQEISQTFVRLHLMRLSPSDYEKFKAEHLSDMKSLLTDKGIWLEMPTHFSVATKR
jgi:ubiquinone/menaquinone biosynthesis C-methylase UbiE